MKFRTLQDNLRKALWQRIDGGDLTGLRLAAQTGFKQAHISNFLNRKRGLSLEGMDKVLSVQRISVLDLLDPAEINKRASIVAPSADEFDSVVVTDPEVAAREPLIMSMHVREILKFKHTFLRRLRADMEGDRDGWERFVVIKVDAREGMSMYPRMLPGATILLDRHYNSLTPYRKGEQNMYAVRKGDRITSAPSSTWRSPTVISCSARTTPPTRSRSLPSRKAPSPATTSSAAFVMWGSRRKLVVSR